MSVNTPRKANDPAQVEAQRRRAERAQQEQADDLRAVLDSEAGRRLVWRLLGDAGIFRSSFTGNSETFFREGERNLGLKVFNAIHQVCPDLYLVMQQEAAARQQREAVEERAGLIERTDG